MRLKLNFPHAPSSSFSSPLPFCARVCVCVCVFYPQHPSTPPLCNGISYGFSVGSLWDARHYIVHMAPLEPIKEGGVSRSPSTSSTTTTTTRGGEGQTPPLLDLGSPCVMILERRLQEIGETGEGRGGGLGALLITVVGSNDVGTP